MPGDLIQRFGAGRPRLPRVQIRRKRPLPRLVEQRQTGGPRAAGCRTPPRPNRPFRHAVCTSPAPGRSHLRRKGSARGRTPSGSHRGRARAPRATAEQSRSYFSSSPAAAAEPARVDVVLALQPLLGRRIQAHRNTRGPRPRSATAARRERSGVASSGTRRRSEASTNRRVIRLRSRSPTTMIVRIDDPDVVGLAAAQSPKPRFGWSRSRAKAARRYRQALPSPPCASRSSRPSHR